MMHKNNFIKQNKKPRGFSFLKFDMFKLNKNILEYQGLPDGA